MYPSVFIVALSTITKLWKEPKCPSTDEWIKKMWFLYTMEYNLAMRKNEIMPFVLTWMELEGIMLREIGLSERRDICFHSYVDLETLNRRLWEKEGQKIVTNREEGRQTTRYS